MIEINSVAKKYGDFTALENVTIKVNDCSVVGIAGYNGAGKTTLLKVCSGMFKPDAGEVLLDGENVFDNENNKQRLFFLPDEMWFPGNATVIKAAKYYADYSPAFDFSVFNRICELFSLSPESRIKSLSKGTVRQLSLAIAFAAKPKYLLIDETFDGLDPQKKEILKKILLEYIAETEASVIITSHDLGEISTVCDHVVLINGKTVQLDCETDEVSRYFRTVSMRFEREMSTEDFSGINFRKIKISGHTVTMYVYGDTDAEIKKLASLGAQQLESEMLTLEEVFLTEMEVEKNEEKIRKLFS